MYTCQTHISSKCLYTWTAVRTERNIFYWLFGLWCHRSTRIGLVLINWTIYRHLGEQDVSQSIHRFPLWVYYLRMVVWWNAWVKPRLWEDNFGQWSVQYCDKRSAQSTSKIFRFGVLGLKDLNSFLICFDNKQVELMNDELPLPVHSCQVKQKTQFCSRVVKILKMVHKNL